MYDIAIIGAGPAGLTASIYALRMGLKIALFESNSYGGQIVNSSVIENYPGIKKISGFDFSTELFNQAKDLGLEIINKPVEKIEDGNIKNIITKENTYKAKTIILATGLKRRKLDLLNEDKLIGKGISYCATCDGYFFKNKTVAIVGGGNTALEDAIFLSNYCKLVYIIHRRDTFKGDQTLVNNLKNKNNVKILYNTYLKSINGNEILESITTNNEIIKIDGLFIAIGQIPNNEIFKDLINLDSNGYITADESCKTNIDGIFVAGDSRTKKVRQLVTATSDGAIAAINAFNYIKSNNL